MEYQTEFEKLAHGLVLYNDGYDDTYFVSRFMAGLRDDIRMAIMLHRPKDVVTARLLASLHEEEVTKSRTKGWPKEAAKSNFKYNGDKSKGGEAEKSKQHQLSESEDKLATLKDHRRRNGLCFKCGAKWDRNHKCPAQVPIHVLEELWEALEDDDLDSADDSEVPDEVVLAVDHSDSAPVAKRTMKIHGKVGKLEVLILIDSGSVGSFISNQLAMKLQLPLTDCAPAKFVTTDGSPMTCTQKISQLLWIAQGHTFSSTVGILPLQCFDMILGQDWLEQCSPIWVRWAKKVMRFTMGGRRGVPERSNTGFVTMSSSHKGRS